MGRIARAAAAALAGCTIQAGSQEESPSFTVPGHPATAPVKPRWRALISPFTLHFSHDAAHRPVVMLGLERERPDGDVWGGAVFDNSFGQPSVYVFGGRLLYRWSRWEPLYAEWTAGLLYGYKGEYKHKVPLNYNGWSPGVVASLGWQFTPVLAGQLNLLGNSGLMLQLSVDLP